MLNASVLHDAGRYVSAMWRSNKAESKKASTEKFNNSGPPFYDEIVEKKIHDVFVAYIIPDNVLNIFWNYDRNVLVKKDIEIVKAMTENKGMTAGAEKLLELPCKYENWVPCLIQVLQDSNVNQKHVADKILCIINEVHSDPGSSVTTKALAEKDTLRKQLEEMKLRLKVQENINKEQEKIIQNLRKVLGMTLTQKIQEDKNKDQNKIIQILRKDLEKGKQKNDSTLENNETGETRKEQQIKIDELETKLKTMITGLVTNLTEASTMESLMLIFVECKEFKLARDLIEKGVDINKTNNDGKTVLMFAAGDDNLESVVWFLEHGADTRMKDKKRWTAFNHAVFSGSFNCVQALLEADRHENINTCVGYGYTPLMLAAGSRVDGFKCVQKLIDEGADIDAVDKGGLTSLANAAESGNVGCLQVLLEAGRHLVNKPDNRGKTPLMLATGSHEKHFKCMEKLLAADAKLDVVDNIGNTPLACAAIAESFDCIQLLLQISENKQVNIANLKGETPLMLAAAHNTDNLCLKKLLSAGADIRAKDMSGYTALAKAAQRGNIVCLQALLEAGDEKLVNISKNNGETPLMLAVLSSVQCTTELLKAGADINVTDKVGNTALAHAAKCGKTACVQALLRSGSDKLVDIRNNFGQTPLMLAALFRNSSRDDSDLCIGELLYAGADINIKDHDGKTYLDYTSEPGETNVF